MDMSAIDARAIPRVDRNADMRSADLRNADLRDADLTGSDLRGADLTGADLRRACLRCDLTGATLTGTCCDPAAAIPAPTRAECVAAGYTVEDVLGRDRVHGWRTARSMHVGRTTYRSGEMYVAPVFSRDRGSPCHPGIYLAPREVVARRYPGERLVQVYCWRDEMVKAGDKWRVRRLWVR